MTKQKWILSVHVITALVWGGLIGVLSWVQHGLNHRVNATVEPLLQTWEDYFDAPSFSFTDQDGKRVTKDDLRGHVWIADFFFTQCTSACPVLTSQLMLLQKRLTSPTIRFISFSVDPEHDSQDALKKYAALYEGDEWRWRLLRTDPKGLADVAAGMKVAVAPSGDKDNPILHSSMFLLVNAQGKVCGIYNSNDSESLQQLAAHAKSLAGETGSVNVRAVSMGSTAIDRGHALFNSMSCAACHSQAKIAPPLQSLYGSIVRLDDRKMVWADEAYLHESIVNPNAKVVAGYARNMPNYQNYLDDAQVRDLVDYIKSLSANPVGGHGIVAHATSEPAAVELLIDPVCKMEVTADRTTPHATLNGKTYFFCSDKCREQFLKKPADYALTEPHR